MIETEITIRWQLGPWQVCDQVVERDWVCAADTPTIVLSTRTAAVVRPPSKAEPPLMYSWSIWRPDSKGTTPVEVGGLQTLESAITAADRALAEHFPSLDLPPLEPQLRGEIELL